MLTPAQIMRDDALRLSCVWQALIQIPTAQYSASDLEALDGGLRDTVYQGPPDVMIEVCGLLMVRQHVKIGPLLYSQQVNAAALALVFVGIGGPLIVSLLDLGLPYVLGGGSTIEFDMFLQLPTF